MTDHYVFLRLRISLAVAALVLVFVSSTIEDSSAEESSHGSAYKQYHCWHSEGICLTWSPGYSKLTVKGVLGTGTLRYFTRPEPLSTVIDVVHPARKMVTCSFALPGDVFEELMVIAGNGSIRYTLDFMDGAIPCVTVTRNGRDLVIEAVRAHEKEQRNSRPSDIAHNTTASTASSVQPQQRVSQDTQVPTVAAPTDHEQRAYQQKALGDRYAADERIEEASRAYVQALSLSRTSFSCQERVRMATRISWADHLDEALTELRLLVSEDPSCIAARIHLARVLSWKGLLTEAIDEADKALEQSPQALDALLVKADCLHWQRRYREATDLYESILQREDNFEARKGLTYCLLATGDTQAAKKHLHLLHPSNAREEQETRKLASHIHWHVRPRADVRYSFYRDSDDTYLHRYHVQLGMSLEQMDLDLTYRHTDAGNTWPDARAEDLMVRASRTIKGSVRLRAGLGFNQLHDSHSTEFLTGEARVDVALLKGTLSGSFSRELLSETPQLIASRTRMTTGGGSIHQRLTDRFSLDAGYRRKFLSDGNKAHDVDFTTTYRVLFKPHVHIGYKFRFLDFSRHTHTGLFDPSNYLSNRFFTSLYFETTSWFVYAEYYLGHQYYERYGSPTRDFLYGGFGTVGVKPTDSLLFEFNVEGGNFAAGTLSGFSYFTLGPRLLVRF